MMGKFLRFRKEAETTADPMEALVLKERLRMLKKINVTKRHANLMDGPRRVDDRKKTHRVGEIIMDDGHRLSCLVSDFSDSGMRLVMTEYGETPDNFRLRVPTLEFDRTVAVVWRTEDALGVTFA
ncbi:MAG: PilZ domain-containing protein [Pseudomonadota bacterium]